MKSLTVQLEERMLWKLVQFLGVGQIDVSNLDLDESTFESHRYMWFMYNLIVSVISFVVLTKIHSKQRYVHDLSIVFDFELFTTIWNSQDINLMQHKYNV